MFVGVCNRVRWQVRTAHNFHTRGAGLDEMVLSGMGGEGGQAHDRCVRE